MDGDLAVGPGGAHWAVCIRWSGEPYTDTCVSHQPVSPGRKVKAGATPESVLLSTQELFGEGLPRALGTVLHSLWPRWTYWTSLLGS